MSDSVASPVSGSGGFSVESLIEEANKAWDEPADSPPGVGDVTEKSPEVAGVESSTAEQPSQEVVTDRGDGRDPKGRFASKGEKPVEAPPQDQVAKAPDVPQSPTQVQKAEAIPETPPGEVVSPQAEPFSVRFGGRDFEIPGAVRTETHVVIPKAQEENVSRYIGMGIKYESERETVKQQKARLAVEREMFTAETGPVMEEVKRLFEIVGLQDENQFAEAFSAYALELRRDLPILRERMELSKKRQELEIEKRMNAPDPEQVAAQYTTGAIETARGHLGAWKQDPATKSMSEDDWKWVEGRVQRDPNYFLHRAGERLTPEEQDAGVQSGEVYFSETKLLDLVNIRLEHRKEVAGAVEAQKKAIALAKENALRLASGSVPPPPSSGGADSAPAKADDGTPKQYKNMDELKRALGVGW